MFDSPIIGRDDDAGLYGLYLSDHFFLRIQKE
jgi:hypothetical protein